MNVFILGALITTPPMLLAATLTLWAVLWAL
jgi:hypothetical protein